MKLGSFKPSGAPAKKGADPLRDALNEALPCLDLAPDGTVRSASRAFLDLTGFAAEDIVGKPQAIMEAPGFAAGAEHKALWAGLATGAAQSAQRRCVAKDGRSLWLDMTFVPVSGRDGKLQTVMLLVRDVTAAHDGVMQAEAYLDAQGRTQLIAEFTVDGHFVTANANFLKTIGYSLEELKGKQHSSVVDPEQAATAEYREIWAKMARGEAHNFECHYKGKSGEIATQGYFNPIRGTDGKISKVLSFANDVTRRKFVISTMNERLERIARQNLDARIDAEFMPEYEPLRASMNQTVDQLCGLIGKLKDTSRNLKSATAEILTGSKDLSGRTGKQAATVEATSTAMDELAGTVSTNVQRAEQASAKSLDVSRSAEEGGQVMREATAAMGRITDSSAKISNIIGLIDDIAFQTNLLALNASVEAARAGEAGKGFAVVAVEVRRLAQSAAQASSDVKALIEVSAREVSAGSKLVASAAEKLERMLGAVKENNGQMEQIADDSREQAASIQQVGHAVRAMGELIQQNVALVEQTNSAIEAAERQASELDKVVEGYRLPGKAAPAASKPAPVSKTARAA